MDNDSFIVNPYDNYFSKQEKKMEFEVNWFQNWASSRLFLLIKMTIMLRVPHKIRNKEKSNGNEILM